MEKQCAAGETYHAAFYMKTNKSGLNQKCA